MTHSTLRTISALALAAGLSGGAFAQSDFRPFDEVATGSTKVESMPGEGTL